MKNILIIPANATLDHPTDFSLFRLSTYLISAGYHTTLAYSGSAFPDLKKYFSEVIPFTPVSTFDRMLAKDWYRIIYRGWMGAYGFGGELCREYPGKISVMIKDWNYASRSEYAMLIGPQAMPDFDGIRDIFRHARRILTQHDEVEHARWVTDYGLEEESLKSVSLKSEGNAGPAPSSSELQTSDSPPPSASPKGRFRFLPDLCTPSAFVVKEKTYDPGNITLCHAGSLYPTHGPRGFDNHKTMLDDAITLSASGITTHFILPPHHYDTIMAQANKSQDGVERYLDFFYENKYNDNIAILRGESMSAEMIANYDFGFITLRDMHKYPRFIGRTLLSKFALYMEAGIPVMVPPSLEKVAELVIDHSIGIVYQNSLEAMTTLLQSITPATHARMRENVREFRETFTYANWHAEDLL